MDNPWLFCCQLVNMKHFTPGSKENSLFIGKRQVRRLRKNALHLKKCYPTYIKIIPIRWSLFIKAKSWKLATRWVKPWKKCITATVMLPAMLGGLSCLYVSTNSLIVR